MTTSASPPVRARRGVNGSAAANPGRAALVHRQLDYHLTRLRRTWKGSVVTAFVTPMLYVAAMGVVLGGYVDASGPHLGGAPSYLHFVVPGLLAGQAMTIALGDSTYPIYGAIKWDKTYLAMLATPLGPADIVAAQLAAIITRVAISCGVFMLALAPFGVYHDLPAALAAFGVQLLIGIAFAAPCCAYAVTTRSEAGFAVVFRVILVPLYLFSGAFFPITNLAEPLQWLARATPLWHGVDLTRALMLGLPIDAPAAALHVTYLVVLAAVGWWLTVRGLRRRLLL